MMIKVAVLGASGMAGHAIALFLEEQGYDVYRMSRSIAASEKNAAVDATDSDALASWLEGIKPQIIVNAIGILQKEAEERPDIAVFINSYLPHRLVELGRHIGAKLIHLSTDCVFSGETGGYTETAVTDGRTMYDRSKALGEVVNDRDLTFRMSILGPDISQNGTGLFHWFMNQKGTLKGYTRAIWNGVTTIELAKAIQAAIEQDLTGLYHLTPPVSINKYDLLLLFKNAFGRDAIEIVPYDSFKVDKTLVNTRNDFRYEIPAYPQMIEEMKQWIESHKRIYRYE